MGTEAPLPRTMSSAARRGVVALDAGRREAAKEPCMMALPQVPEALHRRR